MCVSSAAESDSEAVFSFAAVYRGYRECRRRKRGTANAQRYELRLLDHLVDTSQALRDHSLLFRLVNRRLGKAVRAGALTSAEAWNLSWLTRVLLKQDLKTETVYRCGSDELRRVPGHKRLSSAPPGKRYR